ncbi:MAG: hypothetical protein CSA32_01420 [Desulfobulbus propionicus]|nr:MAG: hypothetical protein CSA32_01420 [Desulfobulbus propionicus]
MQLTRHAAKYVYCLTLSVLLLAGGMVTQGGDNAWGDEIVQPSEPLGDEQNLQETYEYQLEERSDPFVPFISKKAATSTPDPDEIIEEDKVLTGMQLFEPGQLTLVAVLQNQGRAIAMVEDVTGKGYILKKNILIGKKGMVTDILPNKVLITETSKTRSGREIYNTVTMKLNKDGDD